MGWKHVNFAKVLANQYDLNLAHSATLNAIADSIIENAGHSVNLSLANLANKVHCSVPSIVRYLKALQVVNELIVTTSAGQTNHYILRLPPGFNPETLTGYRADVRAKQSRAKQLSDLGEMAAAAILADDEITDKTTFRDSVPGVSDWQECKAIHSALVLNPEYGETPAERLMNAIVLGKHPNWSAGAADTDLTRPLPYDPTVREDGLPTPPDRHAADREAMDQADKRRVKRLALWDSDWIGETAAQQTARKKKGFDAYWNDVDSQIDQPHNPLGK